MDEYDSPTPVKTAFCTRMSVKEYEDQTSSCTEDGLLQLTQYLMDNPALYQKIMSEKKKDKIKSGGFFSHAKASFDFCLESEREFKLCAFNQARAVSFLFGKDMGHVSEDECEKELNEVTSNMIKVFQYSEGDDEWSNAFASVFHFYLLISRV